MAVKWDTIPLEQCLQTLHHRIVVTRVIRGDRANLIHDSHRRHQNSIMILTHPLFYTSVFDDSIENVGKVFTSVRSLDMPKREQSGPQDKFTTGPITHTLYNEVRRGTKERDQVRI